VYHAGEQAYYLAEDEEAEVFLFENSSYLSFSRKSDGVREVAGQALSEAEAEEVARNFLRDHGLLPSVEVSVADWKPQPGGAIKVVFEAATIPMGGPPGYQSISVVVGADGQVKDLDYSWQEPRAAGKYPIVSQASALDRLRACKWYAIRYDGDLEFNFIGGGLAYVGLVGGSAEHDPPYEFLVPAWMFKGETIEVEGHEIPLESAWVPAVADEYLETP